MRLLAFSALFCILAQPGLASEPNEGAIRLLARTKYAIVFGVPTAGNTAEHVAALIDESVPRIANTLDVADRRPVTAAVYLDRHAFAEATGVPIDSHVVGLATFPAGVIHIDGGELFAAIERVVPHEVCHIMIARALGPAFDTLPLWAHEGIAEYGAGERAAQVDPVWMKALGRGISLEVEELDETIRGRGRNSGLAYAQSTSLVNFLVDTHGEAVIAKLLHSLPQTRDFGESLVEVTGWSIEELEARWRRSVSRRWRWVVLFDSPITIYTLMVMLFLIGLARYLRKRRQRQDIFEEDW